MNSVQQGGGNPALPVANQGRNFVVVAGLGHFRRPAVSGPRAPIDARRALGALHAHNRRRRMNLDAGGPPEGFAHPRANLAPQLAKNRRLAESLGADHQVVDGEFGVFTQTQSGVVHENDLRGRVHSRTHGIARPNRVVDSGGAPDRRGRFQPIHLAVNRRHKPDGLSGSARPRGPEDQQAERQNARVASHPQRPGGAELASDAKNERGLFSHAGPLESRGTRTRSIGRRAKKHLKPSICRCPES